MNIAGKPLNCIPLPKRTVSNTTAAQFVLPGYYWPNGNIACMMVNGPRTLGFATAKNILVEALGEYMYWSHLNFYEVHSQEQAQISFIWCAGVHGDYWAYQGLNPGPAHSLYPAPFAKQWGLPDAMSGDIHFNDAWQFTVSGAYAWGSVPMRWVALHEIGHALGLGHSENPSAVMYGSGVSSPSMHLTHDDIRGIQSIYGVKVAL